ncbi:MAG TPA: LTA synthase family protein [Nocardioidaceae bacterium]|nr:LTA synthase family protein [Nocardioidaceae bacterium]
MIKPADSRKAVLETLVGTLFATLGWAMLLTATLELFRSGGDFERLIGYNLYRRFSVFLIDSAVIWVLLVLILALVGRLWVTFALGLSLTLTIGLVNHQKLELRREPVYPSDVDFLRSPTFLVEMVGVLPLVLAFLGLVALSALLVLAGRRTARVFRPIRRQATPRAWLALSVGRGLAVIACLAVVTQLAAFNADGNRVKGLYESAGVQWAWWSQKVNYERNGVVAGLLYNLDVPPMEMPEDYSRTTMQAIATKYGDKARRINARRDASALDGLNVVVVLSEAFSDPTVIKGATVKGDPIPFTRGLMRRTTSGNMLAQLVGGGTANMEYEALTGLSLADYQPQLNSPYQMLVPKQESFPSAVGYFKEHGHEALAIHPYFKEFYHRDQVYPILGFDRFTYDETMKHDEKLPNGTFASDAAAYAETLAEIQASDSPVFLNLVTMQNHYPFADQFDKDWPVEAPGDVRPELARYVTGLHASDQALEAFLADLSASPEKTAVVFYGDHLPAFWTEEIHELNGDQVMKTTPFFIWTNFPTRKVQTPPLMSPTHFLPTLFDQLNAPLPPFYVLLNELRSQIPARESGVAYDASGALIEAGDVTPEVEELIRDYRLVLYDLSVGERYSQDDLFYSLANQSTTAARE